MGSRGSRVAAISFIAKVVVLGISSVIRQITKASTVTQIGFWTGLCLV